MELLFSELIGAILQLVMFALIPFVWWLVTARKKVGFFLWIGLKKIQHEGKWIATGLITIAAITGYSGLIGLIVANYSEGITMAGSSFAGKGAAAVPAILAYGYIRTGLAEELLFRGFLGKRISSKFGFAVGNTIQALLFGALHGVPFGMATGSIFVTILMTILPGMFGWFQGWLNEKRCGGSILPSWLLHGTMNTIVALLAL